MFDAVPYSVWSIVCVWEICDFGGRISEIMLVPFPLASFNILISYTRETGERRCVRVGESVMELNSADVSTRTLFIFHSLTSWSARSCASAILMHARDPHNDANKSMPRSERLKRSKTFGDRPLPYCGTVELERPFLAHTPFITE